MPIASIAAAVAALIHRHVDCDYEVPVAIYLGNGSIVISVVHFSHS